MNKLIRDKLQYVIDPKRWYISPVQKQFEYLEQKLVEELNELDQSNYEDVSEFADVLEVLVTIARHKGISWDEVISKKIEKYNERGGFNEFIILKGE